MTTSIHNAPRWQGPKGNKTEHFATYRYKDTSNRVAIKGATVVRTDGAQAASSTSLPQSTLVVASRSHKRGDDSGSRGLALLGAYRLLG